MSKYQDLMFRFSRESLKEYLGHDMVDVLIEWMPTSDGLLTKKKLIDMIEYLHGVNILKNRSFRKDLLLAMEARDIFRIRDDCLSSADRQINDANTLIDIICRKQRFTRGYKRYKETSGLIEWKECQIFHSIFT